MQPGARVQAVIELLDAIQAVERPMDGTVSHFFRDRRYIGSKDRAAINGRLYRVLRQFYRLRWHLNNKGFEPTGRALAIAELLLSREQTSSSIDKVFNSELYSPRPLSDVEEGLVKYLDKQVLEPDDMPDAIRLECPDWAEKSLRQVLGENFESEMRAMQEPACLDLRVNTLKASRDDVIKELSKNDVKCAAGKISPWAIRVEGRPPISQELLFKGGSIEVQDEGSQLVALVADVKPGMQVVDFCAGAGGKSLAMAACMENKGRIVATDVLAKRLERSKQRFRRAGIHNVETRPLSSERDKWVKRHKDSFDVVLVDAPCSGTGTWRRDPDKRWRNIGPNLHELIDLQRNILDSAARLVKPGGKLVYATCSLLPDENERQVEGFMQGNKGFKLAESSVKIKGVDLSEGYLRLFPGQHKTDGFFAAILSRAPSIE